MPFNSLSYFLFLPVAFVAFLAAGDRLRWPVLLAASLVFYAALGAPHLLVVLAIVAGVSWAFARALSAAAAGTRRRALLFWAGVVLALAPLLILKYAPPLVGPSRLWVSAGVSYFVFQAVAYLADVHLEVVDPEPHFGWFFLSLAFFPKLLQGPIERTGDLLPQLRAPYRFDYDEARLGLLLFGRGLFKKAVLAHALGAYVDPVYADPAGAAGLRLLLATYAYALQILFDFSGYTDMALGSARLFGIRLTQNFAAPYGATSVAEFWRRWHISFSRWILDYIFKPLQLHWRGLGVAGTAAALLVTFLVSGLWHGARWGFVAWGLLHGCCLAASLYWQPRARRLHRALRLEGTWVLRAWRRAVTFHLVCVAWVFFRAPTVREALTILERIATAPGRLPLDSGRAAVAAIAGALLVALALDWAVSDEAPSRALAWPFAARWALYLLIAGLLLFSYAPTADFIYLGF